MKERTMKERTINAEAFHIEFERVHSDKPTAVILADTSKGNTVRLKVKFEYDCLPYVMKDLREAWKKNREIRVASIAANDRALGT